MVAIVVLVTGATGFVGSHCVRELLHQGYRVRGTVRSKANTQKVTPLYRLPFAQERLELYEIDLLDEVEKWVEALEGVQYVLHVASPVPVSPDESTIQTAIQGTTHVLQAVAKVPSVRKVVLTSSCTAINDGYKNKGRVFDEETWSDLTSPKVDAYARSKTLAEQAAWKLWKNNEGNDFALTVLNPTLIMGPLLSDADSGSAMIVGRMLSFTTFPASPPAYIGVVDVRDVALAHVKAMRCEESDGHRILITSSPTVRLRQLTKWLQKEFGPLGYPVSFLEAKRWMLKGWIALTHDGQAKASLHRCTGPLVFNNSKSLNLLKMEYRDPKESLYTQVYSMLELGMIRKTMKYKRRIENKAVANRTAA